MAITQTFISRRQILIENLFQISDVQNKSDDKWSSLQTAQHCYKIEIIAIGSILNFTGKRSKFGLKNFAYAILLLVSLRSSLKFKAPNKSIVPDNEIDTKLLYKQWIELEKNWQELISQFEADQALNIYFHPVAGKLNLKYTLLFILYHIEHHIRLLRK